MRKVKSEQEQQIFEFSGRIFVTYKFLFKRGIAHSTIYNNTSGKHKNCNTKMLWKVVKHPVNNRSKLIDYQTIPEYIKESYNLPDFNLLKQIALREKAKQKEEYEKMSRSFIMQALDVEYGCWFELRPLYENEFMDAEVIESYCKSHIVFEKCIELYNLGTKLIDIFYAYARYDDLVFQTLSYASFCRKFKQVRTSKSIDEVLIHGLRNQISNNKRISGDVIIEIKRHFSNPKRLNGSQILENVNEYLIRGNRRRISLSSIYKVISQAYIKLECMYMRMGEKFVVDEILPHMHYIPPKNEGTLWLLDGTKFQFAYKDEKSKIRTLTYYVVMDGKTKKIIGYSSSVSENTEMAIRAFKIACVNQEHLPRELIQDRSPAHRSERYETLMAQARLLGVYWRYCYSPQDNGYVERFFKTFQERFCKKYDGYIGDGIRSKLLCSKPSPEELKRILKGKNLKTKQELVHLLDVIIEEYNNSTLRKEQEAKAEAKAETKGQRRLNVEPISLNMITFAQMFWSSELITIRKGCVTLIRGGQKYFYNIGDFDMLKYVNQKVRITFQEEDYSLIYLFDSKTEAYLGCLKRFEERPKAKIERTEEDKEYLSSEKKKVRDLKKKAVKLNKDIIKASDKQNLELPPALRHVIGGNKKDREQAEEKLTGSYLHKSKKIKEKAKATISARKVSFREVFKNQYNKDFLNKN